MNLDERCWLEAELTALSRMIESTPEELWFERIGFEHRKEKIEHILANHPESKKEPARASFLNSSTCGKERVYMQDRYDFPAILHYNADGRIGIVFPDLPGCVSQANSDTEAARRATEALELHLFGMEEDGDEIPQPSRLADVELGGDCRTIIATALMPLVREDMETRATKKTLTIPAWLNRAGEAAGVNFSALLQQAIKEHLGIKNQSSSSVHAEK